MVALDPYCKFSTDWETRIQRLRIMGLINWYSFSVVVEHVVILLLRVLQPIWLKRLDIVRRTRMIRLGPKISDSRT